MDIGIFTRKKQTLITDRSVDFNYVVEYIHNVEFIRSTRYVCCRRDNDRELFGLTSQMRRCAVSIPSNISQRL